MPKTEDAVAPSFQLKVEFKCPLFEGAIFILPLTSQNETNAVILVLISPKHMWTLELLKSYAWFSFFCIGEPHIDGEPGDLKFRINMLK